MKELILVIENTSVSKENISTKAQSKKKMKRHEKRTKITI